MKFSLCPPIQGSPLQVLNDDQSKCIYTQIGVLSVQTQGCANAKCKSTFIRKQSLKVSVYAPACKSKIYGGWFL